MKKKKVLIVDDDKIIREQLENELKRNYFKTFTANTGKNALEIINNENINILIVDVKLPDANGLDILLTFKEKQPGSEVIVITGFGTQDIAIRALKRGAIDYIEKPIKMDELYASLGRAQEKISEKEGFYYTILVIDDDNIIANLLEKILKKEGYEVFSANNGNEALHIIKDNKIDLIITDINMEDMDGIEVLQQAKILYQDIEGIMVTGYKDQQLAVKSLRAGAIDYITKPVDTDELLFSIKKTIEKISLNRNRLYRDRELKITSEIISKMNEELEKRIEEKATELSQIQVQLFQTSKLATLGEMAAGLAHEMNQPLGGIALIVEHFRKLLIRGKLSEDEIESGIADIDGCVKRMSKIIHHIRTFARQDTLKSLEIDVNETIESALNLLGEQLRLHQIEIIKNLSENLPKINGEPYQLEQVWINLISNARDAVDAKEESISKGILKQNNYQKNITISTKPFNNSVEINFSDNGIGIPDTIIEKIFDPFFTTKEVGKATGLGLSISYGIIESHKGKINVKSNKKNGTSITVLLNTEVHND